MSEMSSEKHFSSRGDALVDKPIPDMSQDEHVAWYLEYMETVPEENVMMMSGLLIEIEDNPQAFYDYVAFHQMLMRQGME